MINQFDLEYILTNNVNNKFVIIDNIFNEQIYSKLCHDINQINIIFNKMTNSIIYNSLYGILNSFEDLNLTIKDISTTLKNIDNNIDKIYLSSYILLKGYLHTITKKIKQANINFYNYFDKYNSVIKQRVIDYLVNTGHDRVQCIDKYDKDMNILFKEYCTIDKAVIGIINKCSL